MSVDPYRRVFPLYLSAFERFMQMDDRKHYPMCFIIAMRFGGQLRRDIFEQSLLSALHRHPILQAKIERAKRGRMCWVHYPDEMPYLNWADEDAPLDFPVDDDYIDLRTEIGLRIWVRQGPERAEITFYFHHSCVDGIAAHRFMGDIFAFYANNVNEGDPATFGEIQPELLKNRGRRQQLAGQSDLHPHTTSYAMKYLVKMSIIGSDSILPPRGRWSEKPLTPRFGVFVNRFEKDDYRRLRNAAIKLGVTVNDILLAQTFLTSFYWNAKHRRFLGRRQREIRILMPVDLRSRGDEVMPCTNMTSYNFIIRRPKHLKDPVDFVQGIRNDTSEIKNKGMGSAFIDAITRATFVPGFLRLSLPGFRCTATVVFSNVGDPTRRWTSTLPRKKGKAIIDDNLVLEDFNGVPPLRPYTRIALAVTTYMRGLTVSFRCDPHYFKTEDSQEVIGHFMDGLREWIRLGEAQAQPK